MMTKKSPMRVPALRITISLYDDQHAALTDALKQVRPGLPRTARLATLAHIGLLAENGGLLAQRRPVESPVNAMLTSNTTEGAAAGEYEPKLGDNDVLDLFAGTAGPLNAAST
jgi:hypothetical protein